MIKEQTLKLWCDNCKKAQDHLSSIQEAHCLVCGFVYVDTEEIKGVNSWTSETKNIISSLLKLNA